MREWDLEKNFEHGETAQLCFCLSNNTCIYRDEFQPNKLYQMELADRWAFTYGVWEPEQDLHPYRGTDQLDAELGQLLALDQEVEPYGLAAVSLNPEREGFVILVCRKNPMAVFTCSIDRLKGLTAANTQHLPKLWDKSRTLENPQALHITEEEVIAY